MMQFCTDAGRLFWQYGSGCYLSASTPAGRRIPSGPQRTMKMMSKTQEHMEQIISYQRGTSELMFVIETFFHAIDRAYYNGGSVVTLEEDEEGISWKK